MAEYVAFRDGGKTTQAGIARPISKIMGAGFLSSTDLKASQRGAGANMSVDISVGDVFIASGLGYHWQAWIDAIKNVTVTASDPSNPRRTIIVGYIDEAVVSDATDNNQGAFKFLAVDGTPAGSPSDPSDPTIQAAVGAANEYVKIARIAVGAAATNIVDANITDLRTLAAPLQSKVQEIHIPIVFADATRSNTAYAIVPNSQVKIDFSKFTNLSAAYFEVNANTGGANTLSVQLWNGTDGSAITGSEVTTAATSGTVVRSGDIKANLPSVEKTMAIQTKIDVASNYVVNSARLVLQFT